MPNGLVLDFYSRKCKCACPRHAICPPLRTRLGIATSRTAMHMRRMNPRAQCSLFMLPTAPNALRLLM